MPRTTSAPDTPKIAMSGEPASVPSRIAAIYRSLRKANEDAKNEPGAADFYYGAMEMRRHSPATPFAERLSGLAVKTILLDAERPTIEVEPAVVEYGNAIRELAIANIFPGDLLWRNFGVTRYGRVVFYDFDEIEHLTDENGNDVSGTRFVWASEDHAVATVDRDGVATAKGNGAVTITATAPAHAGSCLSLEQYGWGNSFGSSQNGRRNRLTVYQDGARNHAIGTQSGKRNRVVIGQDGRWNGATANQYGRGNIAGIAQFGRGHTAITSQDGHGNAVGVIQAGRGNHANVTQIGRGNVSVIVQD